MLTKRVVMVTGVLMCLGAALVWVKYEDLIVVPRIKASLVEKLYDPGSVQFRGEHISPNGWLCGELNSKNSFGGYVGFKRFIAKSADGMKFIEDHGWIGQISSEDQAALSAIENNMTSKMIKLVASDPTYEIPLEAVRSEMAKLLMFREMWKDGCERGAPRT